MRKNCDVEVFWEKILENFEIELFLGKILGNFEIELFWKNPCELKMKNELNKAIGPMIIGQLKKTGKYLSGNRSNSCNDGN